MCVWCMVCVGGVWGVCVSGRGGEARDKGRPLVLLVLLRDPGAQRAEGGWARPQWRVSRAALPSARVSFLRPLGLGSCPPPLPFTHSSPWLSRSWTDSLNSVTGPDFSDHFWRKWYGLVYTQMQARPAASPPLSLVPRKLWTKEGVGFHRGKAGRGRGRGAPLTCRQPSWELPVVTGAQWGLSVTLARGGA